MKVIIREISKLTFNQVFDGEMTDQNEVKIKLILLCKPVQNSSFKKCIWEKIDLQGRDER